MSRSIVWFVAALLGLWVLRANVSPDFTPIRSELANARGFSRGVFNLVVLPADQPFARAPALTLFLYAAFLLVLAGVRPAPRSDWRGVLSSVLAAMAVVLLSAVAVSPFVSPYRIVLAPRTFALFVLLAYAARAFGAVSALTARWTMADAARRRLLIVSTAVLGAAFFASAMFQTLATYDGNYSGFLHLSREVAARAPFLQERPELARSLIVYDAGYDGQFMYLMAFDPFLRRFADRPQAYRAFVDNPPYRYGRIGFSVLTKIASARQSALYPAAMLWLIVAAHFTLAALLASAAARHGMAPLAALWSLAIPGFMSSLMSALPEALAAAGIVAGYLSWKVGRPVVAALSFAAALLVRETGIILILAIILACRREEPHTPRRWPLAASLLPVCAWRLFVAWRLFPDFGWAAIAANPNDFGAPFAGLLHLWQAGLGGAQPPPEVAAALVFPFILPAALILAVRLLAARSGPLEIAAVVYGAVAVSLNYDKIWSHLPSGERGTFELFVCLLLLLLESGGRPVWVRRTLTGLFLVLLAYTFFVAPDASTSRAALLLIR